MTTYRGSFRFDTVAIIDSLPSEEDPQTGVWLRDIILGPSSEKTPIQRAATRHWVAAAWFLERKFPERWRRRVGGETVAQPRDVRVTFCGRVTKET